MFGDRLKLARKKAGLSQRDLAGAVQPRVSAQAISRYEANAMMPSSRVLMEIARILNVSADFLMSSQVEQLEGVEFRKRARTPARDRARVEALVIEQLEKYLSIERVLDLEEEVYSVPAKYPCEIGSYEGAEQCAEDLRQKWNLGGDPIPSMVGLLEDKGVKVIETHLPDDVAGLTCFVRRGDGRPPVSAIVVSNKITVERKRFTLAHELGHRIIASVAGSDMALEKAIQRFAGAFLMPRKALSEQIGASRHGIAYEEIKHLKHFYGVAASAMLVRLGQVGVLPDSVVSYAFKTYAKAWRHAEPDPIEPGQGLDAFENPGRFEGLVYRALAEELISPARAAELLDEPLAEIERGLRGPQLS